MRTDFKALSESQRFQVKPGRRTKVLRGFLISALGAIVIATLTPTASEAASSYIWISRVNGKFVIQGRNLPKNAQATVSARFAGMYRQKIRSTDSRGYLWASFTAYGPARSGRATAKVYFKKARVTRTASANLKPVVSHRPKPPASKPGTGNPGNGTTTTTRPPTTTTTRPTTTTTTRPITTTTTTPPSSNPGGGGSTNGWSLVTQENFDGNSLNENRWGIYVGRGNQGIGRRERSAVSVSGGQLHITGRGEVGGGVALRQRQTYGKYEIRSRMEGSKGYNKAELLWPSSEVWPRDIEIDISEVFSNNYDESGSFIHYGLDNKQKWNIEKVDTRQWHTYGVEWTPTRITFFLDGKVTFSVIDPLVLAHKDHFLALQLDVAKGERVNAAYHVDWVKVYKRS